MKLARISPDPALLAAEVTGLMESIGEVRHALSLLTARVEKLEAERADRLIGSIQGWPYELTVAGIVPESEGMEG